MGNWIEQAEKLAAPPTERCAGLAPQVESAVLAWLDRIGETDSELIRHVLEVCHLNPPTLSWILNQQSVARQ